MRVHRGILGVALLLGSLAPPAGAALPGAVPVIGRTVAPNGFHAVRPCTLMLLPPGTALVGPGLVVRAQTVAVPDTQGEFSALPFGPDDATFDQVNVFWHAQQHLERLRGYGLDLEEIPISVIIQAGIGSGTRSSEPVSTIGTGKDGRFVDTKDGDIIVHEITHAVFNPRMPTDVHPLDKGENGAVPEGIADYFAAVAHGDTRIGEYSLPPVGYYDLRTDPAVYHYSRWTLLPGDAYSRGKILNGALLELRSRIGEVADALTFQALDHRPLRCMPCFADAMRWADLERNGGANLAALDAAFASRGIGGVRPAAFALHGPTSAWKATRIGFRLVHHCGIGPLRTRWEQSLDGGGHWEPLPMESDSIDIVATTSFLLRATIRDRLDRASETLATSVRILDPEDPTIRLGRLRLSGPAALESGQAGRIKLAIEGSRGVPPLRIRWSVSGATVPATPPTDSGITIISQGRTATVAATCTDSLESVASDTLRIPVLMPLRAGLEGPVDVPPGQPAIFIAAPKNGLPPYRHAWRQRSRDGVEVDLDTGESTQSRPSVEPFEVVIRTTDARGIEVEASHAVSVRATVGAPGDREPRRFRVCGAIVSTGGTVTFELPEHAGTGALEILDVMGRVTRRIPATATAERVEVAAGAVPGLFFARLTGLARGPTLRFVVLP